MRLLTVNKKSLHNRVFATLLLLLLLIGVILYLILRNAGSLEKLENKRYKLYALGTELKESSEDFTKYCRAYVITGNSLWEQEYWDLLNIRNGLKPRPDGRTIALLDSLRKQNVLKEEFEKISLAEKRSNELVWTERVAFNAMKGLYPDSLNEFTIKARPDTLFARYIVFNKRYQDAKDSIMKPIREFLASVDKRTAHDIEKQSKINDYLLAGISIIVLFTLALSFYAIIVLRKEVMNQILELQESNKKLIELNSTKDKFHSIIAHDLKNPFNTLLNLSILLKESLAENNREEIQQMVQMMYDSASLTYKLLENLLEWSRIQTGRLDVKPTAIKPSELISDVLHFTESLAHSKKIKIETKIESDESIYADEEMVKAILRNLMTNAIKYTYSNGTVKIETEMRGENILFTVSDNGTGIDPESLVKLFDIGNKNTIRGTGGEKGTGMGLALCKEFVELNKGEIWVESEPGKGSAFRFTIPLMIE
ncbi:MAG: HAMP domain-containing sensor histidine kinase [Bacteroidales bacterium]|nr:HAMP domain-containing histidine kinase [Bacteroidales bacterium]MDD2425772.1 HAMP domain-containing sensor histidine kinase [Bacteroidales bacterium]MDD3988954.1 HAMP domain-containing sensor histidine kinase [Bacteroidales bacterium]MDD4638677.1 HAMP domain-containing sensor histidine kinase [Bacteroidales bacterium]